MDLGLAGKAALVTASSRGLGRASAAALLDEGAGVTICGRDETSLRQAEKELGAGGGDVLGVLADVTGPDAPERLVEATLGRFGRLDVLVANAGGPPPGRALEVEEEALIAALNANLLTSIRLVRAALPHLRAAGASGGGRICLIASVSVKQPIPTLALSNTARTGLWAWAKTAAQDLAPDGITLNLACPGFHATERMTALGGAGSGAPMGDPADFGRVVAFLCSAPARFVNGVALQVDGGATLGLL
ncbi:MAG: SDR family oxidoreductase [Acidimicrobiales bacterium]